MTQRRTLLPASLLLAALAWLAPQGASALLLGVECITGGPGCATGEAQFSVELGDMDGGTLVSFLNEGPEDPFISEVYLAESGGVLGSATLNVGNVGRVLYSDARVAPNHLPGQNDVPWRYMAEPVSPGSNKDGVDPGERLGIWFDAEFAAVADAVASGDLMIGLRGQAFDPDDVSESFRVGAAPVPEPGAALLFGLGAAVVARRGERRSTA